MSHAEIVRTFYECFNRGDIPGAFIVLHRDVEFHEQKSLPWGGIYRGHDGMHRFLGALVQHFGSDLRVDVHQYIEAPGDQVVVHATLKVLDRVFPYLELWRIRDDQVIRIQPFLDTAGLMARMREVGRLS